MKRVAITGGSGFIGSWLLEELLMHDIEIFAFVREEKHLMYHYLKNQKVKIIKWDMTSADLPEIPDEKIDVFYHLGWEGVSPSYKNEINVQLSNITMSINAIKLCKILKCGCFIAAGTVAEYVFVKDIMNVNAKQTPNDVYGAAKVSAHYFLEVLSKQWGVPFIWTVIPSTFGERRRDNNIITYTIKCLLNNETPMYGNLEQMWDFLYVSDVVRALRMIGECGKTGKTYGIGSGIYMPLKDYIKEIRDIVNPVAELGIGKRPEFSYQTFSSCVNIYDLISDTGFSPKVSFAEGIKKTTEYWRKEIVRCKN